MTNCKVKNLHIKLYPIEGIIIVEFNNLLFQVNILQNKSTKKFIIVS